MKKTMKARLLVMLVSAFGVDASAASLRGVSIRFEPVVGFERAYKPEPSPHTRARLLYGARVIAGHPLISGELEATRASDSESYPSQVRVIEEQSDKLKLGLRSRLDRSFGAAFVRAGGQAQRISRQDTVLAVTTETTAPWAIHPYAGAGLELGGSTFRLTGTATVVFRDLSNWTSNDLETTLGFRFGI